MVHYRPLVLQGPHALNFGIEPERLDALHLQGQGVYFGQSFIGAKVHIDLDKVAGIVHLLIGLQIEEFSPEILLIRDRYLGIIKQKGPSQLLIFLH